MISSTYLSTRVDSTLGADSSFGTDSSLRIDSNLESIPSDSNSSSFGNNLIPIPIPAKNGIITPYEYYYNHLELLDEPRRKRARSGFIL